MADPYWRARYLPTAIERCERKLAALYAEDKGRRADVLCKDPKVFSRAWERAILQAQKDERNAGREFSIGLDNAD